MRLVRDQAVEHCLGRCIHSNAALCPDHSAWPSDKKQVSYRKPNRHKATHSRPETVPVSVKAQYLPWTLQQPTFPKDFLRTQGVWLGRLRLLQIEIQVSIRHTR